MLSAYNGRELGWFRQTLCLGKFFQVSRNGKTYWFDFMGDCPRCDEISCNCEDSGRHYFFVVKPLTSEQLEEAMSHIKSGRNEYLGPNLNEVMPIGWFTDGCNQNFYAIVVHKPGCNGREHCECIITKK
jgi:hypothetical protein